MFFGLIMEEDDICDNLQEELRSVLRFQLQNSGVGSIVRKMVREISTSKGITEVQSIDPDEVLQEIYNRGLMKNILESLKTSQSSVEIATITKDHDFNYGITKSQDVKEDKKFEKDDTKVRDQINSTNGHRKLGQMVEPKAVGKSEAEFLAPAKDDKFYLLLEICGGRTFLDHIYDNDKFMAGDNSAIKSQNSCLILHVLYKSQRFCSKRVQCRTEPQFKETFIIDIGFLEKGITRRLLETIAPLKFILVREDEINKITLLSHGTFDFRFVLMDSMGPQNSSIELKGVGPEHNIPIGILDFRVSILPQLNEQLSKSAYSSQLALEKCKQEEIERLYLVFTRQWWKEYLEIRPEHQNRLMRLFSYDENTVSRPVQSFIKPIASDRLLNTPYQAAWFVSLIPLRTQNLPRVDLWVSNQHSAAAALSSYWQTVEATLLSRSGNLEDHATLLCSLLLGFGLDSYVALGTKFGEIPWVWVVTLDENFAPTFWESITGQFYKHIQPEEGEFISERIDRIRRNEFHKFLTVDCMFNNKIFLANIQPSNSIEHINWNISNPSKWKQIPECTIQANKLQHEIYFPLNFSTQNALIIANDLEIELKLLASNSRKNLNLTTNFDKRLSQLLGQELVKYEHEVSTGIKSLPSNLETVILKHIPPGYDFKAYPFHFSSLSDAKRMYRNCMREPKMREIIQCRGADVHLAIRCDVFTYPEDITSVRIMFACKYLSTSD